MATTENAVFSTYIALSILLACAWSASAEVQLEPVESGGRLFYFQTDYLGAVPELQLWKSDGTTAGTEVVRRFSGIEYVDEGAVNDLVAADTRVFFVLWSTEHGRDLWTSDGTEAGTLLVKGLLPGEDDSFITYPIALGNQLLFFADDGLHGNELWASDGTSEGTRLVKDITEGRSSTDVSFGPPRLYKDRVVFATEEDYWRTDGTDAGTVRDTAYSYALTMGTELNGSTYFADEGGIWRTDDSGATRELAIEVATYAVVAAGDQLFFPATDPEHGEELWVSDGTTAGTQMVLDIRPGVGSSSPQRLNAINGVLLFNAYTNDNGRELWASDGTAEGTRLLEEFVAGSGPPNDYFFGAPRQHVMVGNTLFFTVESDAYGVELWKSDGSPEGTQLVKDIRAGANSSNPRWLTAVNGALMFFASNHLWVSDGTEAGTVQVMSTSDNEGEDEGEPETDPQPISVLLATQILDAFEVYDANSDNRLSRAELAFVLDDTGFDRLDADESGFVNDQELAAYIQEESTVFGCGCHGTTIAPWRDGWQGLGDVLAFLCSLAALAGFQRSFPS
ncbi:MAG: hypothetical protein GC168_13965 [Candidatus Hydrogenedens sp.]|nr:hypothetical protein [Candidatus Hydrogenedens sp.]